MVLRVKQIVLRVKALLLRVKHLTLRVKRFTGMVSHDPYGLQYYPCCINIAKVPQLVLRHYPEHSSCHYPSCFFFVRVNIANRIRFCKLKKSYFSILLLSSLYQPFLTSTTCTPTAF